MRFCCWLVLFSALAGSMEAGSIARAVLVDSPPRIDGRLDDQAWSQATVIEGFQQREPFPGAPVSQRTEVLICYDRAHLYVGFRCFDDPRGITAKELARDVSLGEDDRVQIILDTFLDGRNGYWFQIGPRGSIGDAIVSENGASFNKEWDGLWQGRARIHDEGWDAEIAIPFRTLNFRPGESRWGLKLIRHIRRNLESSYWPVANVNSYRFQVSDSGFLEGLEEISQGVGLDLAPYGLSGFNQSTPLGVRAVGDAGLDAFYQLTPGLQSALTLNTDFAQTEVDTRQINLTRFPLFFPEKRDFFLQGANYFSFGPIQENPSGGTLIPFFSRRVGLDAGGNPIPIIWGAKMTGQVQNWNVGFLNIMDDRDNRNPNFTVARVRRNLGQQSSLGAITTLGNALSEADSILVGTDFKLASSTFRGNKNIALSLFGLKSSTTGLTGRDHAFGAQFAYPNDFLNLRLGFHQIEENFRAALGFVPRLDIREYYFDSAIGPRPERWGILQYFAEAGLNYITDMENRLMTRGIRFAPAHVLFRSGDALKVSASRQYEHLDRVFQIHPTHAIPQGSYEFARYQLRFESAQRRNLWFGSSYGWGSFYDGNRRDVALATGYKISVPVFAGVEYIRNRVDLPTGSFTTNISRLSLNLLFSPDITLYSYLQYDNLSRAMGWQSRLRWILKPGNEILLVWNSRWQEPLERIDLSESTARVKVRYNYRF
jgi:hypothetical protein